MKAFNPFRPAIAVLATTMTMAIFTGCESTDGGGGQASVYYGVGFHDPWYYGDYYDDVDIIVTPPDTRPPDRPTPPPRPTHPIAPPPTVSPRPMPMPSIPAAPRPSFRR